MESRNLDDFPSSLGRAGTSASVAWSDGTRIKRRKGSALKKGVGRNHIRRFRGYCTSDHVVSDYHISQLPSSPVWNIHRARITYDDQPVLYSAYISPSPTGSPTANILSLLLELVRPRQLGSVCLFLYLSSSLAVLINSEVEEMARRGRKTS